jgi:hypothetical protein
VLGALENEVPPEVREAHDIEVFWKGALNGT